MSPEILDRHALIEAIFDSHREHARGDDAGYEGPPSTTASPATADRTRRSPTPSVAPISRR